ncbi:ATP-dependent DNA helicase RecG [Acidithiobacillus caldus SM-1]|uniref:ATP-dependent DNA helicase RecG n=1 Tax=Acidithiobacillus caldus (strain SM-1) TaxID=990288 RepID=F9ZQQ5_ACICS|nr:DEAD/DEAH box helicase [Acidithiobacillus caldus]AEK58655.1 ATP-dependent DNA helicase RecG [Acidithiobacillus caldus SM-1]
MTTDKVPKPRATETPSSWQDQLLRALFTVPMRYEDRRSVNTVADLVANEKTCIRGTVKSATVVAGKKGPFLKIVALDDTHAPFHILWFNFRAFQQKQLAPGNTWIFSGKPKRLRDAWTFFNPDVLVQSDLGGILPIYRKEGSENSAQVGSRVRRVLKDGRDFLPGLLPQDLPAILQALDMPPLLEAVRDTHWPKTLEEAYRGREALKIAEMLLHMHTVHQQAPERTFALRPPLMLTPTLRDRILGALPFSLSPSQSRTWDGIEAQLRAPRAQDLLLLGGVGSGKSAIAYLAAFTQCLSGPAALNRALLIAPTVILARQLYKNLQGIASTLGVRTGLYGAQVYGSAEYPEQMPQIWVGTNGLLNAVTDWDRIGLVVFDEEHRYGKDTKTLPSHVHRLLMTATPIPHTLAHQRFGALPIFRLENDHHQRNVHTEVLTRQNPQKALEQVHKTLSHQRKALIVYAAVQEREQWVLPERVFFLHPAFPVNRGVMIDITQVFPEWKVGQHVDTHLLARQMLPYAESFQLHDEAGGIPFYRLNRTFSAKKLLNAESGQQNLFDRHLLLYDKDQPDRIFLVPEHALRSGPSRFVRTSALLRACQNEAFASVPLWRGSQLIQGKSLEMAQPFWEARYPGQVAVLHGKMSPVDKDLAVEAFRSGEKPLLIASNIVEVGMDIPGAETVLVADAERMGVASLAQLRGRVGRHGEPGYCFFLGPAQDPDAIERLQRIAKEHKEERLAVQDFLERGFGDGTGASQSGNTGRLFRLPRDAQRFLQVAALRKKLAAPKPPDATRHPQKMPAH